MGGQITDNSLKVISSLDELTHLRVTQIGAFQRCPARFRAEILGLGRKRDEKGITAANIGTACHSLIEQFLRGGFDLTEENKAWCRSWGFPRGILNIEFENLWRYLQYLEPKRPHVLVIEHEFTLALDEAGIPVVGHIDAVFKEPDGGLLVMDHKTNRTFENADWWKQQLQPIFYLTAASSEWCGFWPLSYEIGYVNLGQQVRWRSDGLEHRAAIKAFRDVRRAIEFYRHTGEWPERLNDYCNNCPVRDECSTIQHAHADFMKSFLHVQDKSVPEQYVWANNILKTIQVKVDELKGPVVAEVQAAGGKLAIGNSLFATKTSRRREVEFSALQNQLYQVCSALPGDAGARIWRKYQDQLNEMVSVKVTQLDNLLLTFPEIREEVEKVIVTSESEKPTLSVKTAG